MPFELLDSNDYPVEDDPELYEERCQNEDNDGICGGKVWSTGGNSYYNGSYNCYTLYLHCEKCGDYDVECV